MASATIKMNDDGSFNLLVGATDLGTGSDTILAQMAAEVLGVPLEDMIVYSSDTDFTPFDKGAYASSTTYISGGAVRKAALKVAGQIKEHAAHMLGLTPPPPGGGDGGGGNLHERQASSPGGTSQGGDGGGWELRDRQVFAPDGTALTLEQVALSSLHQQDQHQIIASASHLSYECPPPFGAQFVELTVDTETGQVTVERILMVADAGRVINPITASGQVEGALQQVLGFAHCEEMVYDEQGRMVNPRFGPVSELPMDGIAPAMADAIHDATGVWMREVPFTPERVWRALREGGAVGE
jgi:putative selenate reductase molybdopterin-binding subunit